MLTSLLVGCGSEAITVVTWAGVYAEASKKAIFEPFSEQEGVEILVDSYTGGLSQIRAQVETGSVHWDVVDVFASDLIRGCEEGLFEIVDVDSLPPAPDGTPAREDYSEGTMTECGGGGIFYSSVIAYNRVNFPDDPPTGPEDFFDLAKFPGRRSLRSSPEGTLELALMADGVPAGEVYRVLSQPDGVDRAFRKLDTIKAQVIWWEAAALPPQLLADREVVMATAFNGRIYDSAVVQNQPLSIVWSGQVLDFSQFGIVAGTRHPEAARRLLQYASRPETLAELGRQIAYSPTRRSALELITTHDATAVDMRPHMPISPKNMEGALVGNPTWWIDNSEDLVERFNIWLAQ